MSKKILLVIFILVFSFFFRFYDLVNTPEGLDQTEAAFGYNSYSVLKSGKDEYGAKYPLILTSIGDFKLAGFMYWEIPFVALFGLSEFSVRFSAVVASIITLFLIFKITFMLSQHVRVSLLTLFFTSIAPWHLLLSRMGYDPILAMMMYLAAIYFFLLWVRTKNIFLLALSSFTFCWAMLTYYAVWVIFPFSILFFILISYRKIRNIKNYIIPFIIILIPVIFTLKIFLITRGERLNQDSTYQSHAQPILEEMIREDQDNYPSIITRGFHNKIVVYPQFLLSNFFNNLNFEFLFLTGDKIDRRFYTPFTGVLYLFLSPFVFLGILYFWKKQSLMKNIVLLGFISIIFLGSAFSEFGSETERTLIAAPIFSFYISYGLYSLLIEKKNKKWVWCLSCIVCLGLIFNISYFNHQYFWHAKVHEPWGRAYGTKEMISLLPGYRDNYKKIVIPDSSYIFYYFYNRTEPQKAIRESLYRLNSVNFVGLKLRANIDGYMTMPIECPSAGKLNTLYVCLGNKVPKNSKILKVVRYKDGQPSYTLIEFSKDVNIDPLPKNLTYLPKWGLLDDEEDVLWKTDKDL